jgi:hypothetical protein
MAVRLTLKDGSVFEADSVEDVARFYQQLSRNGSRAKGFVDRPQSTDSEDSLPDHAKRLVSALLPASDGLDTAAVATALGVEPRGIGGYVTSLTAWGKRRGLVKKQLVQKERRANGHGRMVRRIKVTDFFRKMISEGKVPGMKLDS